jgi:two-component system, OmpR family, response regulator
MVSRIIVVDDEIDLAEAFAEYLGRLGHIADAVADGAGLDAALRRDRADLVLLDLRLRGENGHDILARIKRDHDLSVILISGHAAMVDRIQALEMGADDVLAKPVDLRELAARVEAVLRNRRPVKRALIRFEHATADLGAARLIHDDGRIERLDAGEVALLRVFRDQAGRLLSRAALLEQAPGNSDDALERSINNRVMRLRAKIGTAAIATVRGGGYRFDPVQPVPGKALPDR